VVGLAYDSVWVVRMWCRICTDPILRYFDNLEGLNNRNMLVGVVPKLSRIRVYPRSPFGIESQPRQVPLHRIR
jgi:hypothetical protein